MGPWAWLSVLSVLLVQVAVAVLGVARLGRISATWPLGVQTFDQVRSYVGPYAAHRYVWYWRTKVAFQVGYFLVLLSMVGSALWGDGSSRRVTIVVALSAVFVLIVTRWISTYWTVRTFAKALNIPLRQGWGLALFRVDKLLERLANLEGT